LLLWGGFDLLRFYWANVPGTLAALERAVKLNPNDSSALIRLAELAGSAGDRDVELAALKRAADLNPDRISTQEAYARALITSGQDQGAYDLYQKLLVHYPRNVDALVNYGLLAQKLGHRSEAIDSWQRAVELDPAQTNAQLYLAQLLEAQGELQAAARHYRAYLQTVSTHTTEHSGEGTVVISALMKVADADAAAKQDTLALQECLTAEKFAAKIGNASLQSLAMVHAADVQEQMGQIANAAASYQQAIVLDERENDPQSTASDWLNYAQFLERQRQPERLIYACLYRAEDIMNRTPGAALDAIVAARKSRAGRSGVSATSVPANLSKLLSEALSLSPADFSGQQPAVVPARASNQ
jgi:tetratricopeptide (TPR) repeat protein